MSTLIEHIRNVSDRMNFQGWIWTTFLLFIPEPNMEDRYAFDVNWSEIYEKLDTLWKIFEQEDGRWI